MKTPKELKELATQHYDHNKKSVLTDTICQLQTAQENNKKIVLVYQMGKVGSTTYTSSLEKLQSLEVFHIHRLKHQSNQSMIKYLLSLGHADLALKEFRWQVISQYINQHKPQLYIISAMRNPIARNMSAFFQNKSLGNLKNERDIELLIEGYLSKYNHDLPITWFDEQFNDALGINILDYPFNKQKGWVTFRQHNIHCLLMTAEAKDSEKASAINAFLDTSLSRLLRKNSGESKDYAFLYKSFKGKINLPASYINAQLNNKVVRHFYTHNQIQEFKCQWRQS
ncbi:MAG: hypothetical protein L3J24_10405 [Xanthomonadales bacterium]|nr:hypothetical protein [Xanthomonadales bacterium]